MKPGPDMNTYDRAWDAIASSDELANARRKLSLHELRLIIRTVLTSYAEPVASREIALWMIHNSYATGHGDTIADLLSELEAQAKERARKEPKLTA